MGLERMTTTQMDKVIIGRETPITEDTSGAIKKGIANGQDQARTILYCLAIFKHNYGRMDEKK